jgi:glycosyltransferase involved in cell wall biosynthesis
MFISSAPATRVSSGYHVFKAGKTPIMDQLAQVYDIKSFCWTKRREQQISLKGVYLLDGFQIITSLLRCLLKGRFNVVVTTGIPVLESVPAFVMAKLLRIPIIFKETHWYWPNTLTSKFTWPINKLMVSSCNLVICPGKKAYAYWRSLGIPEKKIMIVPFYASVLQINPQIKKFAIELRSRFGDKVVILYFGRLIKKKGVDYLIRAFANLQKEFRRVVLLLAGEGPERLNLEKLCRELQLSDVVFTGAVDERIKPAYFLAADIYVYPSITLELPEEWPLGVVEAMSVGKPVVVTTAVGSAPDVVKQGVNGYIVQEKDADALYFAIKRLMEDEELKMNMGMKSKEIIEEFYTYRNATIVLQQAIAYTKLRLPA